MHTPSSFHPFSQSHTPRPIFHHLSEGEVIHTLKKSPMLYWRFNSLNDVWKQLFLDYCTGKKTLPLTYDPFFKKLFHPDVHPERLSRFLSSLLGRTVKVIQALPIEDTMLEGGVLLIMDILVELDDGSLANIEVQKVPYSFPGQRMSCYSADLLLRQYSRVKGELGKDFKYDNIKKVYTIILFEKSISAFHQTEQSYVHMGKTVFDTGLDLDLLQEYCLIALDVYRENLYARNRKEYNNERGAWIGLLATENVEDAEHLIAEYGELYA